MKLKLHYAYDPLCGWCYAAAPLVKALRDTGWFDLVLHGGGMLTGQRRRRMDVQFRELIRFHEQHMHRLSGQPFGERYTEGLLRDGTVVYDSGPPTLAIRVVEALSRRGADMYERIQRAHYVEGRTVMDKAVLTDLATDLGVDGADFATQWDVEAGRIELHYNETAEVLARMGGQGYPTLALAIDGRLQRIDHGGWYGRPEALVKAVAEMLWRA